MKCWKVFLPLLLLGLCACGQAQTKPDVSAPTEPPAQAEVPALSWDDLVWDEHLELAYAQSFAVDYAQGGFTRITIDNIVHLLVPEGAEPPADTPEGVVVLRQPLQNIYLQATAAMDCFRQLEADTAPVRVICPFKFPSACDFEIQKEGMSMNKERRGRLEKLLEQIVAAKDSVDDILSEEEAARDNFPENLIGSEAYERSDAACDSLSEAVSSLEDAISSMEAATE